MKGRRETIRLACQDGKTIVESRKRARDIKERSHHSHLASGVGLGRLVLDCLLPSCKIFLLEISSSSVQSPSALNTFASTLSSIRTCLHLIEALSRRRSPSTSSSSGSSVHGKTKEPYLPLSRNVFNASSRVPSMSSAIRDRAVSGNKTSSVACIGVSGEMDSLFQAFNGKSFKRTWMMTLQPFSP